MAGIETARAHQGALAAQHTMLDLRKGVFPLTSLQRQHYAPQANRRKDAGRTTGSTRTAADATHHVGFQRHKLLELVVSAIF